MKSEIGLLSNSFSYEMKKKNRLFKCSHYKEHVKKNQSICVNMMYPDRCGGLISDEEIEKDEMLNQKVSMSPLSIKLTK